MESSRRAVESYRRSRVIDSVTSDDDTITPVYRLDEVCAMLKSSQHDVVREVVEFIFKRLDHKSPVVKQKALRLIKYSAAKAGTEFRREIQRQSAAIRQLFHYKGQPDPLKGDNPNKAVRETAHEAISALFAADERPITLEDTGKRIQGFGSTNYEPRPIEKKTMLGEVVELGTQSLKQGLTLISSHYNQYNNTGLTNKSNFGDYEAPRVRRSLSNRDNSRDFDNYRESPPSIDNYRESPTSFERDSYRDTRSSFGVSSPATLEPQLYRAEPRSDAEAPNTKEEKLVDSVTTPGGLRLQPSRDNIQAFLLEAQKLDAVQLYDAMDQKLQAHSWQVRLKTLCYLEGVLRQKEIREFQDIAQLFEENSSTITECLQSPQTSLREKAKKVLSLLGSEELEATVRLEKRAGERQTGNSISLPDLIDTQESISSQTAINELTNPSNPSVKEASSQSVDLLGDDLWTETVSVADDTFAGMSVHASESDLGDSLNKISVNKDDNGELFAGLNIIEDKPAAGPAESLVDLFGGLVTNELTINGNPIQSSNSQLNASQLFPINGNHAQMLSPSLHSFGQTGPINTAAHESTFQSPLLYGTPMLIPVASGVTHSIPLSAGALNYGPAFGQPNFATGGIPQYRGPQVPNVGVTHLGYGQSTNGFGLSDGFDFSNNSMPIASYSATECVKKEDTKAFDFIADHVTAVRSIKR